MQKGLDKRSCTDVLCLAFFVLICGGIGGMGIWALGNGDVSGSEPLAHMVEPAFCNLTSLDLSCPIAGSGQWYDQRIACWELRSACVRRALQSVLRPANCKTARILYVPPWGSPLGSAINVYAALMLRALDYGYTIVQHSPGWTPDQGCSHRRFTFESRVQDVLVAAPLFCFFRPPSSCSAFGRKIVQANASTLNALLVAKVPAIELRDLHGFFQAVPPRNVVQPWDGMDGWTVESLANRLHVPSYYIFSHIVKIIFNPNREVAQLCTVAERGKSGSANVTAAVHVRAAVKCTGKLTDSCDGRDAAPLPVYLRAMGQLLSSTTTKLDAGRLVVLIASDTNSIDAARFAGLYRSWWRNRTEERDRRMAFTEEPVFVKYAPRSFPSAAPVTKRTASKSTLTKSVLANSVLRETLDAICDMRMLAHADYFVGTASNWMHTVNAVRLATSPTKHFPRSAVVMTGGETKHTFPVYLTTDGQYEPYWSGVMNAVP